jgi:hypothetical protein
MRKARLSTAEYAVVCRTLLEMAIGTEGKGYLSKIPEHKPYLWTTLPIALVVYVR